MVISIKLCIVTTTFLLFLTGCQKESKNFIDDSGVAIYYKNDTGQDLLNPQTVGHFVEENIRIYNIVDGLKKEVYYPANDNPRNFTIQKKYNSNDYYLSLGLEADTTLIQLSSIITDTLTCIIEKSDNYIKIKKVWYNGVLKWDFETRFPQEFTVIK